MRRSILIVIALAGGLLAPSGADAKSFRGTTSQHRRATVLTGADGQVRKIRVSYDAPCRSGNRFSNISPWTPPFDSATPDAVADITPKARARVIGGGRIVARLSLTAKHHLDPAHPGAEHWSGTYAIRAVFSNHGHWYDTCELKRVRWTARVVTST